MKRKTNEKFVKEIINCVGNEYIFLEKYINNYTKIKCKHNICGHVWKVRPVDFLRKGNRGTRCPKCNGGVKKTNKDFVKEVGNLVGDKYTFLEKYINSKTKISCKHNECGHVWKITPNDFLKRNRCPECNGTVKKTNKEFRKEVYSQVGNEYEFLEKYINRRTKIKCRHNECGHVWKTTPGNFLSAKRRCPACTSSKGENKIEKYLESYDLNFKKEYSFQDLTGKRNLFRFDFAVFRNKKLLFLIEYDGIQHFFPIKFFGGEKKFVIRKGRDRIKSAYCYNKKIPLIRIPYFKKHLAEKLIGKVVNNHF